MSYETLIFYSVVTSVITLDRVNLKKKVVDAPEILTVIDSIPNLTSFLNSLYGCQYGSFFQVNQQILLNVEESFCIQAAAMPNGRHYAQSLNTLYGSSLLKLNGAAAAVASPSVSLIINALHA